MENNQYLSKIFLLKSTFDSYKEMKKGFMVLDMPIDAEVYAVPDFINEVVYLTSPTLGDIMYVRFTDIDFGEDHDMSDMWKFFRFKLIKEIPMVAFHEYDSIFIKQMENLWKTEIKGTKNKYKIGGKVK